MPLIIIIYIYILIVIYSIANEVAATVDKYADGVTLVDAKNNKDGSKRKSKIR